MRFLMAFVAFTCVGFGPDVATAGEVAYVEWSSSSSGEAPSDWGYNAFDGKAGSAWCSSGDPSGEMLTLGFIGAQQVDEIGIIVGALNAGKLDKSRSRVRELEISDGMTKQTLVFRDRSKMQTIKLRPALKSQKMTFTVTMMFAGERRSSPVCISEILLKSRSKEITGDTLGRSLRGVTGTKQKLLHLWIDQPGAPERYLTFGLDGSFLWVYEPILDGKRARISGKWQLSGSRLVLSPKRSKPVTLKVSHGRVADGDSVYNQLVLDGTGPHDSFPGTYQNSVQKPR